MERLAAQPRSREDWRRGRSAAIKEFLSKYAGSDDEDLLFQMLVTICRLAADGTDRGDLKILNVALKELRYAFKVFAPYVHQQQFTLEPVQFCFVDTIVGLHHRCEGLSERLQPLFDLRCFAIGISEQRKNISLPQQ